MININVNYFKLDERLQFCLQISEKLYYRIDHSYIHRSFCYKVEEPKRLLYVINCRIVRSRQTKIGLTAMDHYPIPQDIKNQQRKINRNRASFQLIHHCLLFKRAARSSAGSISFEPVSGL